jgi:hypothetical protein
VKYLISMLISAGLFYWLTPDSGWKWVMAFVGVGTAQILNYLSAIWAELQSVKTTLTRISSELQE